MTFGLSITINCSEHDKSKSDTIVIKKLFFIDPFLLLKIKGGKNHDHCLVDSFMII